MIPTRDAAKSLWEKYNLPEKKQEHVTLVAQVANALAQELAAKGITIDTHLLWVAALLHDIDKAVPKLPGERHPDAGVRILQEEHMNEVAHLVRTHPLHAIADPTIAPKSWEEKILYLADKMVKQEVVGVDGRFALWRAESLPPQAVAQLDACYPKVKALESEVAQILGLTPQEMTKRVSDAILKEK
jgi:putative nucleotidyltransferase with HDIG domain